MDMNYNINKLDEILKKLFKETLSKKNDKKLNELLNDLLEEKDSGLISNEYKTELSNYSKETIRLLVEKNILLSIENKALALHKSYWEVLKARTPRISVGILNHYFDTYISDLKKDKLPYYKTRTIDELNKVYDSEIQKTFNVFENNIQEIIDNSTSINLDHMENLNTNGRVVSIKEKMSEEKTKKGGIFLDKDSKIGYGKFVNKDELLNAINNIKSLPQQSKITIKNDKIDIDDLKVIVESIGQTLKVDKNEKVTKQDARIITSGSENKKAGNIFLGNKGIDLPNGEYVSVEEMTLAVNKFINEKENRVITKPTKVINIKGKFQQIAVAATLAISVLSAALLHKNNINNLNPNIIVSEVALDNEKVNTLNDLVLSSNNENIIESNEIEKDIVNPQPEVVTEPITEVVSVDQNIEENNIVEESEVKVEEVQQEQPVEVVESEITEVISENTEVSEQPTVIEEVIEPINQEIQSEMPPVVSENDIKQQEIKIEEVQEPIEQNEVPTVSTNEVPTVSINEIEETTNIENEIVSEPVVEQPIVEPIVETQPIVEPVVEQPILEQVVEPQQEVQPVVEQSNYTEGTVFQAKPYNMYSSDEIYQLAAIVGGEDNGTYEGALAVISTMCNRADSNNSDPLSQAKSEAYSAYGGEWYNSHINGGIPDHILSATIAGLAGTRNTTAVSFRGSNNSAPGRIQIGEPGRCNNYFDFLGGEVIMSYGDQISATETSGKTM